MFFLLQVSVLFSTTLPFLILVGSNGGRAEIKMASASTPLANEKAKDLTLLHTVQLKPIIKAQISGMISSGTYISDVAIISVHFETRLKKFIIVIKNRKHDGY